MDTIYFVLPAYNEEANIEDVIKQWHPVLYVRKSMQKDM